MQTEVLNTNQLCKEGKLVSHGKSCTTHCNASWILLVYGFYRASCHRQIEMTESPFLNECIRMRTQRERERE